MTQSHFFALLISISLMACAKKEKQIFFIGTYTEKLGHVDGKAEGIYTCAMDEAGKINIIQTTKGIANPSFVSISPDKKHLYAVAENGGKPDQPFGSVVAYKINADYSLLKINEIASYGIAPCHVSVSLDNRFVFVANYATGNIVSYKILENGALSDSICTRKHIATTENSGAGKAWAHQVVPVDKTFLMAMDKGADKAYTYLITPNGNLIKSSEMNLPNGAGPRHFAKHPTRDICYIINENNSTISVFNIFDKNYSLETPTLQTVRTIPDNFSSRNSCADIHVHPNGKFVYASNRGHNSIALFSVSEQDGRLTFVNTTPSEGEIPRNFHITPDGKKMLVANQNSSNISIFSIDEKTGLLTLLATSAVPTPVCVVGY